MLVLLVVLVTILLLEATSLRLSTESTARFILHQSSVKRVQIRSAQFLSLSAASSAFSPTYGLLPTLHPTPTAQNRLRLLHLSSAFFLLCPKHHRQSIPYPRRTLFTHRIIEQPSALLELSSLLPYRRLPSTSPLFHPGSVVVAALLDSRSISLAGNRTYHLEP